MRPQTVKEVRKRLQQIEKDGFADHILLVSNDEECNGYHELYGWCQGTGEPMRFKDSDHPELGFQTKPTIKIC